MKRKTTPRPIEVVSAYAWKTADGLDRRAEKNVLELLITRRPSPDAKPAHVAIMAWQDFKRLIMAASKGKR